MRTLEPICAHRRGAGSTIARVLAVGAMILSEVGRYALVVGTSP